MLLRKRKVQARVRLEGDGDPCLAHWARSGKLARAAKVAIREHREAGRSVTFKRGEQIIRLHADGVIEVLATVDKPVKVRRPAGVGRLA